MKLKFACIKCGSFFLRKPSEAARGRNKYCSKSCAIEPALRNRNQLGDKNPNWKGGVRNWKPSKAYLREKQLSYRARFPVKRQAHTIISEAIRNGKITRLPCKECGAKAEAHHENYAMPLDVIWLCKKHHMERHKEMKITKAPRSQK